MDKLSDLETIQEYGGWDETRDEYLTWIRKDQVEELIKEIKANHDAEIADLERDARIMATELDIMELKLDDSEGRAWDSDRW